MIPETLKEWATCAFFLVWAIFMIRLLYKDNQKEREMSSRSGSETRQRDHQVGLRLTEEEFAKLSELADEAGMSVQDYIRWQTLSDAPMA